VPWVKGTGFTFMGGTMQAVLQYLKTHGQCLDSEIAVGMGISINQVRIDISALAALGEITTCSVTRFNGDERFEGTQCRPASFIPPKAPGRKPGAPSKVTE
jgi:predicted ArsR family transcriptional regulator